MYLRSLPILLIFVLSVSFVGFSTKTDKSWLEAAPDTVIHVKATPRGFSPSRLTIPAGKKARLVLTRFEGPSCADHVMAPALGIEKTALPVNKPVAFELGARRSGSYDFTCGMGMLKGTIVVK